MKKIISVLEPVILISFIGLAVQAQGRGTAEEEFPLIDQYRRMPDGTPRYVPIRGFMCQAIWECDGLLTCTAGNTGLEKEEGKPYFSPLLWALLDYQRYSDQKKAPDTVEYPCIQGNTPQKARELVVKLIQENNNNCVNDSFGGYFTPLLLAQQDDEIIHLLLKKGADPNKAKYLNGTTLLYIAASQGRVDTVRFLLSYGANPTLEFNPSLRDFLSGIMGENDLNRLKCIALILGAQGKWKQ